MHQLHSVNVPKPRRKLQFHPTSLLLPCKFLSCLLSYLEKKY